MPQYFFKPFKYIFLVLLLGGLGVFADIAQLTNFNLIHFLKVNSPLSYYLLFSILINIYLVLLINFLKQANIIEVNEGDKESGEKIDKSKLEESEQCGELKNVGAKRYEINFKIPFVRTPYIEIEPYGAISYDIKGKSEYGFTVLIIHKEIYLDNDAGFKWKAQGQIEA